uniref:(northern house mosquito) hypothetical protein n=1 Tax=Culex pipiens TaxID=7175 RepID=A0A8D8NGQ5_CULPI
MSFIVFQIPNLKFEKYLNFHLKDRHVKSPKSSQEISPKSPNSSQRHQLHIAYQQARKQRTAHKYATDRKRSTYLALSLSTLPFLQPLSSHKPRAPSAISKLDTKNPSSVHATDF